MSARARPPAGNAPSSGEDGAQRQEHRPSSVSAPPTAGKASSPGEGFAPQQEAPPPGASQLREELRAGLQQLDAQSLRRRHRVVDEPCGPHVTVDGEAKLAFCSNDYLGLAGDAHLAAALAEGAARWGCGSGASALVSGYYTVQDTLARRLADFVGLPAALLFTTGYMANNAVLPALLGRGDAVFADRLNHASLVDGALLSRAEFKRYPHGDLAALEQQLAASTAKHKAIVSDSVFSMDGDLAPLAGLLALAERYDAWLIIDDAHGFGVLGPQGRGACAAAGLDSWRLILMGTLGKAAGVAGAFVAGCTEVIQWLTQHARPHIFTTAAPPALAHALLASLDIIETEEPRRAHLQALIRQLREGLAPLQRWRLMPSETPIQPLLVGDNADCLALSRALWDAGLWVPAIRPPTVPKGTARLRISLSAAHTAGDVARLVDALRQLEARP